MNTGEKVVEEFNKTLLNLRYPGIAQIDSKDMENTILGSDNRLFLLSWLLRQSPFVPSEEFATSLDEVKLVKWFTNMGICISVDALMGKVPVQDQITTLRNLLLFMKNVLICDEFNSHGQSSVVDVLKKHIGESINIIPPTCSLTSKLNYNEAMHYLNSTKQAKVLLQKTQSSNEVFDANGKNNSSPVNSSQEHDEEKVVEKFLESFESVSTWPQLKNELSTPALWKSMDTHVENVHCNMNMLKKTLRSKKEISNFAIADKISQKEMLLDDIIEDVVIRLEEVNNLHKME